MTMPLWIAALLIVAATIGITGVRHRTRLRLWHVLGCALSAIALWFTLFPPTKTREFSSGTLIVLTPGITPEQLAGLADATRIALPGVDGNSDADAMVDLASALRLHPDTRRLVVIGGGLPARDRDAARGLDVDFRPAPLPRGVVDLSTPMPVVAGAVWRLKGRVNEVPRARIELRDPADRIADTSMVDEGGNFALTTRAGPPGSTLFVLRVLDNSGALVESVPIALVTTAGDPVRVLLVAGAPDADLKYLRRWARDAGLQLDSRMALTKGIAMQEGDAALDIASLENTDLLIVDERSWAALDANEKAAIGAAVGNGLGLLLRITGPLPPTVVSDWANLGITLNSTDAARNVALETHWQADTTLIFSREPVTASATTVANLLHARDGSPLAVWRNHGNGRIAAWWLKDSYRLRLAGDAGRYGTLWSSTLHTLARARATAPIQLPADLRLDQRAVMCAVAEDVSITTPTNARVALIVDEADKRKSRCAAFWPRAPGWYRLDSGDEKIAFRVRARGEAAALARSETANATRVLANTPSRLDTTSQALATRHLPLPRWPFFLLWLTLTGLLWWLEQRQRIRLR